MKDPPDGLANFRHASSTDDMIVNGVHCKGKFMWWDMGAWKMWYTYGMSGQWNETTTKHTALVVGFRSNDDPISHLYFNDPRHFGTVKFVNDERLHQKKLASLGPDMLTDPPSPVAFLERIYKRESRTIAEALMDQSVVSGVGNYIKAESLYLAEISPHRKVDSLTSAEILRLRREIVNVMRASYATGGATFSTYKNPDGSSGSAQQRFVVYGNKTDPLGHPVVKEETADGRTTHWCPQVQR